MARVEPTVRVKHQDKMRLSLHPERVHFFDNKTELAIAGGLAWLLDTPKPPAGASKAERLYLGLCVTCHGVDGRGSWRATLFLIRPGDLADAATAMQHDQYLFEMIKHGGAPIGRPGMPAFGSTLSARTSPRSSITCARCRAGADSRQLLDPAR